MEQIDGLSRLAPELAILIVVGYFFYKMIQLAMKALDDIQKTNAMIHERLAKAIDKNTHSTDQQIITSIETARTVTELKDFMINLNGSLKKVVKDKQAGK